MQEKARIPLYRQARAVQTALNNLPRLVDDLDLNERARVRVELEQAHASLERFRGVESGLVDLVDHLVADLVVERAVQTPRGYAETALAMQGDGVCLADPRQFALDVAEQAITHVLHDLTRGALPVVALEGVEPKVGSTVPLVFRSTARLADYALKAVGCGEGELYTPDEAALRLVASIFRGELSLDSAEEIARTVVNYCDRERVELPARVAQAAGEQVCGQVRAIVGDISRERFCGFCGRLRDLDAERACEECARLRRDEATAEERGGEE